MGFIAVVYLALSHVHVSCHGRVSAALAAAAVTPFR
jgi:hypothetical protein